MKWLIWREYRLNRLILTTGAVLLLLPYLVFLIVLCWPKPPARALNVTHGLEGAAFFSLILSQVTVALLGGNAIAGERADRSAEFIAYLPLSRKRSLGGKLILAFSVTALIWATNLLVLWILARPAPGLRPDYNSFGLRPLDYIAVTGLVFFGVGWLISSFQSSPTFAVGGGLITPLLVVMVLMAVAWAMDVPSMDRFVGNGYAIICPIIAIVCFSIGIWYYLHRVEP